MTRGLRPKPDLRTMAGQAMGLYTAFPSVSKLKSMTLQVAQRRVGLTISPEDISQVSLPLSKLHYIVEVSGLQIASNVLTRLEKKDMPGRIEFEVAASRILSKISKRRSF